MAPGIEMSFNNNFSPRPWRIIFAYVFVRGQKCHVICERSGDQKRVERVTMNKWQVFKKFQIEGDYL